MGESMRIPILFLFFTWTTLCVAQEDNGLRLHFSMEYGVQVPILDMRDRFGTNFELGSQVELMTLPGKWTFGLQGNVKFGSTVKEDVIASLRTPEGEIIGNDRSYATVFLRERGFYVGPYLGRVFNLSKNQPHSGIKLQLGGGLLQHKVRIQDDSQTAVQLAGDKTKGYDRLSNGAAISGFLGYQHLDINGTLNFIAGFDFQLGFTQSRREIDFGTGLPDATKRKDGLIGFKIGWILPIINATSTEEIYY